jgi:adenylate cyclase
MHSQRRATLVADLTRVIAATAALPPSEVQQRLSARVEPLLDSFLLQSKPIVGAEVSILLADIRGFTALMQTLPTPTMVDLLNGFFASMSAVIARHGGIIDKFMGDSIMALFGAPERQPDDLPRALACAAEMQQTLAAMNAQRARNGEPRLYAGIAVNTGNVMLGSFGSALHSEYTVIGDAVNLVSRMEAFSLRGQVLLSTATRRAARDIVEIGRINEVRVKGLEQSVSLHELVAVNTPKGRIRVPRVEPRRSPRIQVDLAAMFRQIECKRIMPEQIAGRINDLGYYGLGADLPLGLPSCAEVLVNQAPQEGIETGGEVYARVVDSRPDKGGFRTSMEFTSIDTPGHRRVKDLVDDALWRR